MFTKTLPGKAIRIAEANNGKQITVPGGDHWIKDGNVIAYRQANGLAGLNDEYFVLSSLI